MNRGFWRTRLEGNEDPAKYMRCMQRAQPSRFWRMLSTTCAAARCMTFSCAGSAATSWWEAVQGSNRPVFSRSMIWRRASDSVCLSIAGMLAAALADAQAAPDPAEWRRQLLMVHQASNAHGICEVRASLRRWQEANWPEGKPVVDRFQNETVLPNFLSDPAQLQGKSQAEIDNDLFMFCTQTGEMALSARNQMSSVAQGLGNAQNATAEDREKAGHLVKSLESATFRGECKTVSPLFFNAAEADKKRVERFVHEEIYGKDDRFRQERLDTAGMSDQELLAATDRIIAIRRENEEREVHYWKLCDIAESQYQQLIQELQKSP